MLEIKGDLFEQEGWIAITTNGVVKRDHRLVMGAGIAKYARDKWRDIDLLFGKYVKENGNIPCPLEYIKVISFPTKHHYKENSSIELIKSSALWIKKWADKKSIDKIYLSRVGCGMGNLNWDHVKSVICEILDDRFIVVY